MYSFCVARHQLTHRLVPIHGLGVGVLWHSEAKVENVCVWNVDD